MICYQNQYVTIEVNTKLQALVQTWRGFAKGPEYRDAWNESLHIAQEHQLSHWLIDQTSLKGVDCQDWQWVNENWKPRFEQEISESSTAIVLASNIFDEIAGRIVSRKANGITQKSATGYFANKQRAEEWLETLAEAMTQ